MTHKSYGLAKRIITLKLVMLLLLPTSAVTALAQTQIPPVQAVSEAEYRLWELRLRERALDIEIRKAWVSGLSVSIPILVAVLALAGTIWAARQTVVAQFAAKAAELALMGEDAPEIINRAKLIAELYGNLLPRDFKKRLSSLEPKDVGRIVTKAPWTSELWKDVVEILAQQPADRRDQIIEDFLSMFPRYTELKTLKTGIQAADKASRDPNRSDAAPI
jgi:hypothetical protein